MQQALASELAELLLTITTTKSSLAFLRGFWETTVREWNGIDRLRYVIFHLYLGTSPTVMNLKDRQILHARQEICQCHLQTLDPSRLGEERMR